MARQIVDNVTATLVLNLHKSVYEVYNMNADDVLLSYSVFYIDSYNAKEFSKVKK